MSRVGTRSGSLASTGKAVGFAQLDEVVSAASSDEGDGFVLWPRLLEMPRIYAENEVVAGLLAKVSLDVSEGDLLVGFTASPTLLTTDFAGAVIDSLAMRKARRRGLVEEDELLALKPDPKLRKSSGKCHTS